MGKNNIFDYGGGKRKIGHSPLDMGFNSLSSESFGRLSAKAVFETLPDDKWWIGQHCLTKVKPMVSPAFTRIHQNWYAFYVRNQQIWTHWNNYITNGTAYGKVYGSNVTNQKIDNPWQVPEILAPDLMLPCKIGNGFGLPIFRIIMSQTWFEDKFATENITFHNVAGSADDNTVYRNQRITDLLAILFHNRPQLMDVPYFEGYVSSDSVIIDLGGMPNQLIPAFKFFNINFYHEEEEHPNGAMTPDDYYLPALHYHAWRLFADGASSDVRITNSPFVVDRKVYTSTLNNIDLADYDFTQRHQSNNTFLSETTENPNYLSFNYVSIKSRFWGNRYMFRYSKDAKKYDLLNYKANVNHFYWTIANVDFVDPTSETDIVNYLDEMPGYLGVTTDDWTDMLDGNNYFDGSVISSITQPHPFTKPNNFFNGATVSFGMNAISCIGKAFDCDVALPMYCYGAYVPTINAYEPTQPQQSPLTDSLGYYSLAFLLYLCKQVAIHLDNMGLPVDAYTVLNHFDYRYESVNALPFFAYSNIWENHFRNNALSTPELDYSESNGFAYYDSNRRGAWYVTDRRPAVLPERFQNINFSQIKYNSWMIPYIVMPKNGMSDMGVTAGHADNNIDIRQLVDGRNHYYTVKDYFDLFVLLTGYALDIMTLKQSYTALSEHNNAVGQLSYYTFATLYTDKYYLPSYYNGLLHQKYQNFNKDYFTGSMLDPMSGANQVELGDTINELRTNETKQSWFERIAKARSVKQFFNAIFGVTPIECDDKARFLGSDHVNINIGEVIQTSQTDNTPQGTRSGLGQANDTGGLCEAHCNEHGFILVLCSHTIEAQYFQGINRQWLVKGSYMDYPTVDFAHIGNESILQKELNYNVPPRTSFVTYPDNSRHAVFSPALPQDAGFDRSVYERNSAGRTRYDGVGNPLLFTRPNVYGYTLTRNHAQNSGTSLDNTFGFVPRWSYYKFRLDELHGEMRDKEEFWHTFRRFFSQPILCHEFINWEMLADSEDLNRIFAVTPDFIEDKFKLDLFINATVDRALPYVCVPHSK